MTASEILRGIIRIEKNAKTSRNPISYANLADGSTHVAVKEAVNPVLSGRVSLG